jgi:D-glycero-alpha-D-manno-heptose-7-phosphate kinase
MIFSKTPYRISLFGGGTDFPEWFNDNKSLIISSTIDKYANIGIRYLPPFFEKKNRIVWSKIELTNTISDISHPSIKAILKYFNENKGVEIHHFGDLPARSGIASSSSFTVGLLNLLFFLNKKKISKKKLSEIAIYIEKTILKEEGGWQDQIIVSEGGFNEIAFFDNKFKISKINIDTKTKKNLDETS